MNDLIVELATDQPKEELVAAYKRILQEFINRRPSGTRMKIAKALDKNKSFVSQITNPNYAIPVPARHLNNIFNICRFSAKERETFLKAYTAAHPNYKYRIEPSALKTGAKSHQLVIDIPVITDSNLQEKIEKMIRDYARQLFALVTR